MSELGSFLDGTGQELGKLVVRIVADASSLAAGYEAVEDASKDVSKELENVQKSSKKTSDALEDAGEVAEESAGGIEWFGDATEGAGDAAEDAKKGVDGLADSLDKEKDAAKGAGTETEGMGDAAEDAGDNADKAAKKTDGFEKSLGLVAGAAVAAAAAIAAVSAAAVVASDNVTKAFNNIKLGTGATGADLEGLKTEFESLAGQVPASLDEVAIVMGNLNTAFDLQGDKLTDLSKHHLALGDITGGDATNQFEKLRAVYNKYNVSVEEQTDLMDYLFRAYQMSGVEVDKLIDILDQGDAGFAKMGLSVKDATAMIGLFAKNDGIEAANELTASLERALSSHTWEEVEDALKRISSAASLEDAENIGKEFFGMNWEKVTGAVRSGALEFEDFADEIESSKRSVQELEAETRTIGDSFTMLGNRATLGIAPVGDAIGKVITEKIIPAIDRIGPYFEDVIPSAIHLVERFGEEFDKGMSRIEPILKAVSPFIDRFFGSIQDGSAEAVIKLNPMVALQDKLGEWWDEHGENVITVTGMVWDAIEDLWTKVGPYVSGAMDVLNTVIDTGLGTILDFIGLAFAMISGDTEKTAELSMSIIQRLMKNIGLSIEGALNYIITFVEGQLQAILSFSADIANGIVTVIENSVNVAIDSINTLIEAWNNVAAVVGGPILAKIERVTLDRVEAPKVELQRVTAFSDKLAELTDRYEQLMQQQASGEEGGTTNTEITMNIYASDTDSAKKIGKEAAKEIVRTAEGGGGRG